MRISSRLLQMVRCLWGPHADDLRIASQRRRETLSRRRISSEGVAEWRDGGLAEIREGPRQTRERSRWRGNKQLSQCFRAMIAVETPRATQDRTSEVLRTGAEMSPAGDVASSDDF